MCQTRSRFPREEILWGRVGGGKFHFHSSAHPQRIHLSISELPPEHPEGTVPAQPCCLCRGEQVSVKPYNLNCSHSCQDVVRTSQTLPCRWNGEWSSGRFYHLKEVCWSDPTEMFRRYKQLIRRPDSPVPEPKVLAPFYSPLEGMRGFFIRVCCSFTVLLKRSHVSVFTHFTPVTLATVHVIPLH